MAGHLLIFGEGFTGTHLRRAMEADGWRVTGTGRGPGPNRLAFDGTAPLPAGALAGVTHVVASIPPDDAGDPALRLHADALAGLESLAWVGYLSTTGVYGNHDGAWVDETTPPAPTAARSRRRLAAEQAWLDWGRSAGVAVQVFRLAGIYGPGRSTLDRVWAPGAQSVVKPGHAMGRIHVDDIVCIVRAGMARPEAGPVFNCADDEPAPTADVNAYAARLLGIAPPPEVSFEQADLSPMARSFYADNRRVRNERIKRELGVSLLYPTYREGLAAVLKASGSLT
ncbi:MAG: SDR family oxidoreductase [Alphaproteobacteria bacterium]|nr:SDR family oxidoreductase [Alphaproteobacteria bacterium]